MQKMEYRVCPTIGNGESVQRSWQGMAEGQEATLCTEAVETKTEGGVGLDKVDFDHPKEGLKWDDGKLDWHALPLSVLIPLVAVFEAGIKKGYGRHNCLNSFNEADERFFSATMRHLEACQLEPLSR